MLALHTNKINKAKIYETQYLYPNLLRSPAHIGELKHSPDLFSFHSFRLGVRGRHMRILDGWQIDLTPVAFVCRMYLLELKVM